MSVGRRQFLQGMAAGAAAFGFRASSHAVNSLRPNILLIITDQQHAGMMSCAGNSHLETPAMDHLAVTGVRFERTYTSNPVCIPARFSMMTGRMPSDVGMRWNDGLPDGTPVPGEILANAMGHVFARAGYETAYGGKTHWPQGMTVESTGFEVHLTDDEREGLAEASAEYLRKDHDKPFLLVASFINPHDICIHAINAYREVAGEESWGGIKEQRVNEALKIPSGVSREEFFEKLCPPLPDNHGIPAFEPEAIGAHLEERTFRAWARAHWGEEEWRLHRWAYCRLTERVDAEICQVFDALRDAGLEENTVVVFTSDHGDMDSAHRLEHKTVLYEESTRVPLLVRWPGVTDAGRVDEKHLISNGLDLLPTLCDFAGIDPPEGLHGRSFRPLTEGEALGDWRDDLVVEGSIGRMLRTGRYKYTVHDGGKWPEQLHDLEEDPGEMTNLALNFTGDKHIEGVLNEHRARLRRWVEQRGDSIAENYIIAED